LITQGAAAAGKVLGEIGLDDLLVETVSVRRKGAKNSTPDLSARIDVGDVLVLRGAADGLAAAEIRLLQG
jgi:CPA2 family monovalent cation:H+ antiporter-2